MVTTTSGRKARIAALVWFSRRIRPGSFGRISAMPISASSSIGNRLSSPCSAMRAPPTPANRTSPSRLSAAISRPPSTSPEGSPAIRKTKGAFMRERSLRSIFRRDPDDEQPRRVGDGGEGGAVQDQGAAGFDGDAAEAGGDRPLHGRRPDRRQVQPPVLLRLAQLDQHPARPLAPQRRAA